MISIENQSLAAVVLFVLSGCREFSSDSTTRSPFFALLLVGFPMLSVTVVTVLVCFFWVALDGFGRAEPPFYPQLMSADIECRAWYFGWAGNDSGHNLKLFQQSHKGGAEHEIARSSYIVSDANRNDPDNPSNCDELYA